MSCSVTLCYHLLTTIQERLQNITFFSTVVFTSWFMCVKYLGIQKIWNMHVSVQFGSTNFCTLSYTWFWYEPKQSVENLSQNVLILNANLFLLIIWLIIVLRMYNWMPSEWNLRWYSNVMMLLLCCSRVSSRLITSLPIFPFLSICRQASGSGHARWLHWHTGSGGCGRTHRWGDCNDLHGLSTGPEAADWDR